MLAISSKPRLRIALQFLLALYVLVVAIYVFQTAVLARPYFGDWDEVAHAANALIITEDIVTGDLLSLLYDIYRQVYWSPVHPLLVGIAFALGGVTVIAARVVSLLLFVAAAILIYVTGLKLGGDRGPSGALIATVLFVSTTAFVTYAGLAMLEIPAIFFSLLAIMLYVHAEDSRPGGVYVALGLSLVATYLTKSNYGLLLMIALGVAWSIEALLGERRLFSRATLLLILPMVLALGVWFAYPPKLVRTWTTLVNSPFGTQASFSPEGLLYYPRAFLRVAGTPWLAVLFVVVLIAALWAHRRNRHVRFLALIVLIQFLIGELHHTKVERHLFPLLPPLFLLTGYVLAHETFDLRVGRGRKLPVSLLIAGVILVTAPLLVLNASHDRQVRASPEVVDYVAAAVDAASDAGESTLVLGTMNLSHPPPPLLDWALIAEKNVLSASHSDLVMNYEQDATLARLIERAGLPVALRRRLLAVAQRSAQPAPAQTLYLGLTADTPYSRSSDGLYTTLRDMQAKSMFDTVIVVMPDRIEASYIPIGQEPYTADFIFPSLERLGLERAAGQVFAEDNVRVVVYAPGAE